MIHKALFVKLNAKPGKENDVENFLKGGLPIVLNEPGTMTWYAVNLSPGVYAIFDTFHDDEGRNAHLSGDVAKALMAQAADLFSSPPEIIKADVIAVKEQVEVQTT